MLFPGVSFMQVDTIIKNFKLPECSKNTSPVGSGHIHKTFKIDCETGPSFILQELNTFVFKNPEELMNNALRISEHLAKKVRETDLEWEIISFIPTLKGDYICKDNKDNYWRVFNYISHNPLKDIDQEIFVRAGEAYGNFIRLMGDLPDPPLHETIPHFHDLSFRLQEFETARRQGNKERIERSVEQIEMVERNKMNSLFLSDLIVSGSLKPRNTHNDAKIDNVLFNENREVVSVIDLDTVMPGIVHSDFGDAIRSFASTAVEDDPDESAVRLSIEVFTGFSRGFLGVLKETLTDSELDTLVYAPAMFAFMQGVRFLNDYLMNDAYYHTKYEDHNLVRAKNQFALYNSMKKEEPGMKDILDSFLQ